MANNVILNGYTFNTDEVSGVHTQVAKIAYGSEDSVSYMDVKPATETSLAAINAKIPSLGLQAVSASLPVTLSNDTSVGVAASIAALNIDLLTGTSSGWFDAAGYQSISVNVIGGAGISAGAITFEETNDITNASAGTVWQVEEPNTLTPTPQISAITISASTVRMFKAGVSARYIRVRVSTGFVGGTVQAAAVLSQMPYSRLIQTVHQPTAGNLNGTMTVTGYPTAAASSDGLANPTVTKLDATQLMFNGTTWDRARNNALVTIGDIGAKTATFNGATQTNYNSRGAIITVAVGTVSGTSPTLALQLQISYDGTNFINLGAASANITTSTQTCAFVIYPTNLSQSAGATPANLTSGANQTILINAPLPRTWRIAYTIGGTTPSFTLTNAYASYVM